MSASSGRAWTKPGKGLSGSRAEGLLEKLRDVLGSDLLEYGQTVIAGVKDTTGQGNPEPGDAFGQAQSEFNRVNETLKSSMPDNGWAGAGSYAYADQNTRQQLRSDAMADADHEVHKVLYREAAQITLRRGYLDDQYNFLAGTSYVTFPLQFIPRYGEAMKMAIEIGALQTALGESYYQMTQLRSEVAENAAQLQQAVGRYSGLADGAELPGAAVNFDPPPPPPGGSAPSGTISNERSQPRIAAGGIAGSSGVSGGSAPAPAGGSWPTFTVDTATAPQPTAPGLPPLPPLPQLPPLPPLGPATGQPAATPGRRRFKKAARTSDGETDEFAEDDKDPKKAAPGDAETERPPVWNPDPLQAPGAARLDPDNSPGCWPGRHRRIERRGEGPCPATICALRPPTSANWPSRGPRGGRDQICHDRGRKRRSGGEEHPRQHRFGFGQCIGGGARRAPQRRLEDGSDLG